MIGNLLAGMLNKGAVLGDYESISTVTVGPSGSTSIDFTSIAGTYKHLQIRMMHLFSVADRVPVIRVNSDTGSNYAWHRLYGTGASAVADGGATQTSALIGIGAQSSSNIPGCTVLDILDYADTNKFKTFRALSGTDANGNGYVLLNSALWQSTSAITSIQIYPSQGNFNQYSHFALYGIKG